MLLLLQRASPGRLLPALPAAVFTGSHHIQQSHRSLDSSTCLLL